MSERAGSVPHGHRARQIQLLSEEKTCVLNKFKVDADYPKPTASSGGVRPIGEHFNAAVFGTYPFNP